MGYEIAAQAFCGEGQTGVIYLNMNTVLYKQIRIIGIDLKIRVVFGV